jgi:HNH endonuclease
VKHSFPAFAAMQAGRPIAISLERSELEHTNAFLLGGTIEQVTVVVRGRARAAKPMLRGVRVGAAARRRIRDGGPIAKGRPALSRAGYEQLRTMLVHGRANQRCERCGSPKITGELEHCVDRGDGGADSWENCWVPCPACRDQKVAPFRDGRLMVEGVGGGRFKFQTWMGDDKRSAYALGEPTYGGRWATPEEAEVLATLR